MKKTVLITGAAKGIGASIAEIFIKNGFNVVINYKTSRSAVEELEKKLSEFGECMTIKADCSDENEVDAMFESAIKRFGQIDVLVNNAGTCLNRLFTETDFSDWQTVINNNLTSAFLCSKAAAKDMIKRHEGGSIVNISSVWGICGASCEVAYSASKSGMIGLTKALAKELGLSGISVNCVAPGVIDTDMNKNLSADDLEALRESTPLNRIGTPEDVAKAVYFLATADFITGQTLACDGGFAL